MSDTGTGPRLRFFLRDPLNLIACAIGLLWGSVALWLRPAGDFGVETDFYGAFSQYSRQWMHGEPNLMAGYRGPGYYLTLGLVAALVRDAFLAAKIISVVGAALGLRAVGALLRRLWGTPTAVAGCLVVASNASWIEYSYRACSDLMFWALFWTSLAVLFRAAQEDRGGDWILAGALAGFAWLTRYNGAALVPAVVAVLAVLVRPRRRAAGGLAGFALTGALVAAPWSVFLAVQTGNPFWSNSPSVIGAGLLVDPPALATVGSFSSTVDLANWREILAVYPEQACAALARNVWQHLWLDTRELMGYAWAAAALLGVVGHVRVGVRRAQIAFALAGLGIYAAMVPVFYSPRFMLIMLPLWGAAVGGLVSFAICVAEYRRGPWRFVPRGVMAALVLVAGAASVRGVIASRDPVKNGGLAVEFKALAQDVRRAGIPVGPNTPIAARKPHVGYYLKAPVIPVGEGGLDEIRRRGAHYLLVSGIEASLYPAFLSIWNPQDVEQVPAPLRFVAQGVSTTDQGDRVATLYAIQDPLPYEPRPSRPIRPPATPRPGFTRIDDLRLRLATWYTAWNAKTDAGRVLDRIAQGNQTGLQVQIARGDIALENDNLDRAAEHYRTALASDPSQERVVLRLASVATLQRDDEEFRRLMGLFLTLQDSTAAPRDPIWWDAVGMRYLSLREHAACLAPFVAELSVAGDDVAPLKRLGYAFYELGRRDDARGILLRYLGSFPNDPEAIALLRAVDPTALQEAPASQERTP